MPTYFPDSTVRDAGYGAHERNRTADLLLTMQMLYRLSYVGSGAARGKIGCEQGPYESRGPTWRLAFSNRAKNPVPTLSSWKKVAGGRESANVGNGKDAVNKKFEGFSPAREMGGGRTALPSGNCPTSGASRNTVEKLLSFLSTAALRRWTNVENW